MAEVRYYFGDVLTGAVIDEISMQSVSMKVDLDAGEFRGTFHLDQTGKDNETLISATIPGRCYCVVERDGTVLGDYILTTRTYQSQAKSVQLYGRGWKSYPYTRFARTDLAYDDVDQLQVFLDLYELMQEDSNSAQVVLPTYSPSGVLVTLDVATTELKTYGNVIDSFANADTGFDWTIDTQRIDNTYQRRLRIGYPQLGSISGDGVVVLEYPGNITNYWINDTLGSSGTHLYVIGGGEGDSMPMIEKIHDDLLAGGFPRYDIDSSHKDIDDEVILDALATQEARIRKPPMGVLTLELKADQEPGVGSYNPGDAVRIVIRDPRFPNTFTKDTRLLSYDYEPPSDSSTELTRLVFEGDDL